MEWIQESVLYMAAHRVAVEPWVSESDWEPELGLE